MLRPRSPVSQTCPNSAAIADCEISSRIGDRAIRERLEDAAGIGVQPPEELERMFRRLGAGVRAGGSRRRCPRGGAGGASCIRRRPASPCRPARANDTRPAAATAGGTGAARAGCPARAARAWRTFEHRARDRHALRARTRSLAPDDGIRRREHVRADAQREVAPLLATRSGHRRGRSPRAAPAAARAGSRAAVRPGDAATDDDDVVVFRHCETLQRTEIGRLLTDGSAQTRADADRPPARADREDGQHGVQRRAGGGGRVGARVADPELAHAREARDAARPRALARDRGADADPAPRQPRGRAGWSSGGGPTRTGGPCGSG